mgnify:CR=1 FL=1|tara:strand:+ start:1096 stop:1341 length:246 start_codon:yes stop_codon:yes gene_type:complete
MISLNWKSLRAAVAAFDGLPEHRVLRTGCSSTVRVHRATDTSPRGTLDPFAVPTTPAHTFDYKRSNTILQHLKRFKRFKPG